MFTMRDQVAARTCAGVLIAGIIGIGGFVFAHSTAPAHAVAGKQLATIEEILPKLQADMQKSLIEQARYGAILESIAGRLEALEP